MGESHSKSLQFRLAFSEVAHDASCAWCAAIEWNLPRDPGAVFPSHGRKKKLLTYCIFLDSDSLNNRIDLVQMSKWLWIHIAARMCEDDMCLPPAWDEAMYNAGQQFFSGEPVESTSCTNNFWVDHWLMVQAFFKTWFKWFFVITLPFFVSEWYELTKMPYNSSLLGHFVGANFPENGGSDRDLSNRPFGNSQTHVSICIYIYTTDMDMYICHTHIYI